MAADFETLYAGVRSNLRSIPWALLEPHPSLIAWLDSAPPAPAGARALVVGCGLGDDAEELAHRGYRVTAFDVAPSALRLAHRRFPDSRVGYQVADFRSLPDAWTGAFDLVVEIRNLQIVPRASRAAVIAGLAACLRPNGIVFVRGMLAVPGRRNGFRQLPVRPAELDVFLTAGLHQLEFHEYPDEGGFVATYHRPPHPPQSSR